MSRQKRKHASTGPAPVLSFHKVATFADRRSPGADARLKDVEQNVISPLLDIMTTISDDMGSVSSDMDGKLSSFYSIVAGSLEKPIGDRILMDVFVASQSVFNAFSHISPQETRAALSTFHRTIGDIERSSLETEAEDPEGIDRLVRNLDALLRCQDEVGTGATCAFDAGRLVLAARRVVPTSAPPSGVGRAGVTPPDAPVPRGARAMPSEEFDRIVRDIVDGVSYTDRVTVAEGPETAFLARQGMVRLAHIDPARPNVVAYESIDTSTREGAERLREVHAALLDGRKTTALWLLEALGDMLKLGGGLFIDALSKLRSWLSDPETIKYLLSLVAVILIAYYLFNHAQVDIESMVASIKEHLASYGDELSQKYSALKDGTISLFDLSSTARTHLRAVCATGRCRLSELEQRFSELIQRLVELPDTTNLGIPIDQLRSLTIDTIDTANESHRRLVHYILSKTQGSASLSGDAALSERASLFLDAYRTTKNAFLGLNPLKFTHWLQTSVNIKLDSLIDSIASLSRTFNPSSFFDTVPDSADYGGSSPGNIVTALCYPGYSISFDSLISFFVQIISVRTIQSYLSPISRVSELSSRLWRWLLGVLGRKLEGWIAALRDYLERVESDGNVVQRLSSPLLLGLLSLVRYIVLVFEQLAEVVRLLSARASDVLRTSVIVTLGVMLVGTLKDNLTAVDYAVRFTCGASGGVRDAVVWPLRSLARFVPQHISTLFELPTIGVWF